MSETGAEQADRLVELVARARERTGGRPELDAVLDAVARLDEVELAQRPELFEQLHQVLRTVLAHAGDAPDPLPVDGA